ncbi:MAG: MMPL family transporter [Thermoleophilaceae bacterium]
MDSPETAPEVRGLVARIAGWTATHRRATVVGWLLVLVVTLAVSGVVGSNYSNDNSLPGTQSQQATDLLTRDFPAQAGDSDRIVLHVNQGRLTDAGVRAQVASMLAKVSKLPHVTGVVSPYGAAGAEAVSRDGRTAFATVTFDERANTLPKAATKRVIATAEGARSSQLQVELGGQAIEQTQSVSFGTASAVGLAAAIIVLLVTFGSFLAAGLPIVTALLGLGSAFGLIALGSRVLTMPDFSTELAAMIGLGVGIDYALFIVTRFRESYRAGVDVQGAIAQAMDTAGRAVLFAGLTVIVALLGMLVLGVTFLAGLAVSSAIAVFLTMLAALTLLPALLARVGGRIGERGRAPSTVASGAAPTGFWQRWAELIRRRPWPAAIAGLAIMVVIAAPALGMRMGLSDQGNAPKSETTRKAYDLLAAGFGPGFNGPLLVVADLHNGSDTAALQRIGAKVRANPDIASVGPAQVSPNGQTAVIEAFPRSSPQSTATSDLVKSLRADVLPPLGRATGTTLMVGGVTATGIDFTNVLSGKLPLFIGIVVGLAALLLLVVFRSLVIPVQAALMNLLSIGAALGVTVLIFQHGWLGSLFGVQPGPIEPWLPVMLFAIVFGLSMDYEVFLVSRIHEEWTKSRDASRAVVNGMASTGRVITAAATIMVCVFLSFVFGPERDIKLFGLSLASAVFLDAFVIRSLLLPSVLELLGRSTWKFPDWLHRRLPRLAIDEPVARPPKPALEEG